MNQVTHTTKMDFVFDDEEKAKAAEKELHNAGAVMLQRNGLRIMGEVLDSFKSKPSIIEIMNRHRGSPVT